MGLFKNLCQAGKINNTKGHTGEYRFRSFLYLNTNTFTFNTKKRYAITVFKTFNNNYLFYDSIFSTRIINSGKILHNSSK